MYVLVCYRGKARSTMDGNNFCPNYIFKRTFDFAVLRHSHSLLESVRKSFSSMCVSYVLRLSLPSSLELW
jgi:hypothetical protein